MASLKTALLIISAATFGFAPMAEAKLSLKQVAKRNYECDGGQMVAAIYYSLSDNSLSFVRLKMGDQTKTLPQVESGSGARYTDLQQVEWWIKGEAATLSMDVNNANAPKKECKSVEE
jgi:membrane-bound inhibitor of C-type lysozyme